MESDSERQMSIGAQWDDRYRAEPHLFRREPDETLVHLVSPLAPGTAVDLGAGEGRNSLWLARRSWSVFAVDASAVALERLKASALEDGLGVETVNDEVVAYLDAAAAGHRKGFDLVVLAYLHPTSSERAHLIRAATRCVEPGGHLFVVAHHRDSLGRVGPPDPDRLYVETDLESVESEGLGILRLERRSGSSDVTEPGVDVVLWAIRPA